MDRPTRAAKLAEIWKQLTWLEDRQPRAPEPGGLPALRRFWARYGDVTGSVGGDLDMGGWSEGQGLRDQQPTLARGAVMPPARGCARWRGAMAGRKRWAQSRARGRASRRAVGQGSRALGEMAFGDVPRCGLDVSVGSMSTDRGSGEPSRRTSPTRVRAISVCAGSDESSVQQIMVSAPPASLGRGRGVLLHWATPRLARSFRG